jgi:hypothetical protein
MLISARASWAIWAKPTLWSRRVAGNTYVVARIDEAVPHRRLGSILPCPGAFPRIRDMTTFSIFHGPFAPVDLPNAPARAGDAPGPAALAAVDSPGAA